MRTALLLLSFFLISGHILSGQNYIYRYGNTSNPLFTEVMALPDGSTFAGGDGFFNGATRAILARLSPSGNPQWSRYYGSNPGAWSVNGILPATDGNLIVLFSISSAISLNGLNAYSVVAKVSAQNGAVIWARRMGDDGRRGFFTRLLAVEDGFVLCGAVEEVAQQASFCLAKMDEDGNLAWQRAWQDEQFSFFRDIASDEQGRLWAAGRSISPGNAIVRQAVLARFSAEGELDFANSIDLDEGERYFAPSNLVYLPGEGPVLGGPSLLPGPAQSLPTVLQADAEGGIRWAKAFNTPPGAYLDALLAAPAGGGLLAAGAGSSGGKMALLARFSGEGNIDWAHSVSADWGVESLFGLTLDREGNLLGAGRAFAPLPDFGREAVVFKVDGLRFQTPSCCSLEEALTAMALEAVATPLSFEEGLAFSINDFVIPELPATLTAFPVCQVEAAPAIAFSDSLVCPGQCVEISAPGLPEGSMASWAFEGGQPASIESDEPVTVCFDEEGEFQITLSVDGCSRSTRMLQVEQRLPPEFTLSDTTACPGECLQANAPPTEEGFSYTWVFQGAAPDSAFGTAPPPACYPSGGQFLVELWLEGCGQRSRQVEVKALPPGFPNAFTPNGDGINDRFSPLFSCQVEDYQLQVFNRWGQRVFQSAQPADSWDGSFEGQPAPSEAYFWTLSYSEFQNGEEVVQKMQGDVVLLR